MSLYNYRAKVSRVVDADTIDLEWVDLGFGMLMGPTDLTPLRVRLLGIDAYETTLRGGTTPEEKALGLEAKAWLAGQIEGKMVRIQTELDGTKDSFGRLLAWVWPDGSDESNVLRHESYNMVLIRMGWAVPYTD